MKEDIDTQTSERLFVLSANDRISTEKAMQNLGVYLERRPEVFQNDLLSNLAYTLGQRKSLHPWRATITASNSVDLVEALFSGKIIPKKQELDQLCEGWVFTGQGAQWWAMGRELYAQYPIYTAAIDKADTHLRSLGSDFSLIEELGKDEQTTRINAAHIAQPACSAIQLALVDLLRSWGLQPSAVVGHSSGEIGAAYAAQIITFQDAMTIAYHRGRLIPMLKKKYPDLDGCMMAIGANRDIISTLLSRIPSSLGEARIACINSPSSLTISGDTKAVMQLQTLIEEAHPGTFVRRLQIDTAYHSHHMNLVAKAYTESLLGLKCAAKSSSVRFYSSLLGRLASSTELDASYWVQNLTCTVRFDDALQSMCRKYDQLDRSVNVLIELGPHAALQGPIKQIVKQCGIPASGIAYHSVLSRKRDAVQSALEMAGSLLVKGALLDLGAINFPKALDRTPQVLTDLPRYAWNHSSKFYHESRFTKIHKFHGGLRNDIIGVLAPYSNDLAPTWRNIVRLDDLPWLRHHQVQEMTVFPISAYVSMALEAMAQQAQMKQLDYDSFEVRDLKVHTVAVLSEEDLEMTITLQPITDSSHGGRLHEFRICSWSKSKDWTEHCTGSVSATTAIDNDVDGDRDQCSHDEQSRHQREQIAKAAIYPIVVPSLYTKLREIGVTYGAPFQGLQECFASTCASVAKIGSTDTASEMPHGQESNYILHPTLLEQLISMYWPIFESNGQTKTVHLPSSIDKIVVSKTVGDCVRDCGDLQAFCETNGAMSEVKSNTLSMFATNLAARNVVSVEGLQISPMMGTSLDNGMVENRDLCYKLAWEVVSMVSKTDTDQSSPDYSTEVLIVHEDSDLQRALAFALADNLAALTGCQPTLCTLSSVTSFAKDKLCIFLSEVDRPILANLSREEFDALQVLMTSVQGVLWVVEGAYLNSKHPDSNMVSGLSRTLRSEGTIMRFVTLDLEPSQQLDLSKTVECIMQVFKMKLLSSSETEEAEFMERDGKIFTPRIIKDVTMDEHVRKTVDPSTTKLARFSDKTRPLWGALAAPGSAEKLTFDDNLEGSSQMSPDDVRLLVKAIGIELNTTVTSSVVGTECTGVVVAVGSRVSSIKLGDRVAAVTPRGSLSTTVNVHFSNLLKLPDHISFEAGAIIPNAYCTATYALIEQAKLCEGEMVLIHDAASAIGQASVDIAQMIGTEVWTTVRNLEQKRMLMEDFDIAEDRIWFLSSEAFANSIQSVTSKRGVNVVLNTITDTKTLDTTWKSTAEFGRFINVNVNGVLPTAVPLRSIAIIPVNVSALAARRPEILQCALANVSRLLRYGKIRPIHLIEKLNLQGLEAALRNPQSEHIARTVVVVPEENELVLVSTAPIIEDPLLTV